MSKNLEIVAYITDDKERVVSGDPLTIYMLNNQERQNYITELSRALRANVIELTNGDHILIRT